MRPCALVCCLSVIVVTMHSQTRPRARDLGIAPGLLEPGPQNAITDVAGVRVGHTTLVNGDNVRTGVTAILPHAGNLFQRKTPGAVFVGNAFGKLAGSTQVDELGTIESPIVLTNTLSVGAALEAVVRWTLAQPGNENVRSVNGLVGETNDGALSDIRGLHVTREHVIAAILNAREGSVEEGAVGAGTGTVAFGATDAPLSAKDLKRVAARAIFAMARTGSTYSNGSGDFAIAFSTAAAPPPSTAGPPDVISALFEATLDAVEEAIYNSMLKATDVTGSGRTIRALPVDQLKRLLQTYGRQTP